MAKWKKLGLIFTTPPDAMDWMKTHATNPIAEQLQGSLYRIYFSCRDAKNVSRIAFIDIDLKSPHKILAMCTQPVLEPGPPGIFDDSGTTVGCLVSSENKHYLYYLGWNLSVTVPWRNSIGLAIRESNAPDFKKHSLAPVLDRNPEDPYTLTYPWVIREENLWRMWYGSSLKWGREKEDMGHVIKYAESSDGISWKPTGHIAINLESEDDYALTRPCVIKDNTKYRMWYSYRWPFYRIGYAESEDGIHWERLDHQAGIDVSESGWDSDSVEYASIFQYQNQYYMLYNGNRYGLTGFGLAVLEEH
jgi:hypothetical protein